MNFESLSNLKLDDITNLWSYVTLKGAYIRNLRLRLKNAERRYSEEKMKLLEEIIKMSERSDLSHIKAYLQGIKRALLVNGYHIKVCNVRASSRVLIGVSEPFGKTPFDVGLYFDPVYNVPFIPGSSLKGAFRHALEILLEKEKKVGENRAKEIAKIVFGSEEWSGLVGVTDAYPIELGIDGYLFEPDVLTPHYHYHYLRTRTELDAKPNPVAFLTIARGVTFQFYIYFNKMIYEEEAKRLGSKAKRKYAKLGTVTITELTSKGHEMNPIENALMCGDLAEALNELRSKGINVVDIIPWVDQAIFYAFAKGVGSKTNIGYSIFEVLEYKSVEG